MFLAHLLMHLRIGLRDPSFCFMTVLLPTGIYWFFAVPESFSEYIASYLVCSFSAFAFVGVLFFQNTIAFAVEKEKPWTDYLHTLPGAESSYLLARIAVSSLFAIAAASLIYITALICTPVDLTLLQFIDVVARLTIGGIPMVVLAMVCGNLFSARAITPVANFLYLSLSFAGGLWKPHNMLPETIAKIAYYLPTYHYGCLVWDIPDKDNPLQWWNIAYLVGFTFILLLIQPLLRRSWRRLAKA